VEAASNDMHPFEWPYGLPQALRPPHDPQTNHGGNVTTAKKQQQDNATTKTKSKPNKNTRDPNDSQRLVTRCSVGVLLRCTRFVCMCRCHSRRPRSKRCMETRSNADHTGKEVRFKAIFRCWKRKRETSYSKSERKGWCGDVQSQALTSDSSVHGVYGRASCE
jgi:hypothetical protein